MTTTELKQRIAEAIKPFWGNYIIGRDVCQLLQDCLKHIEELEGKLKRPKRPKGPKIHIILDGKSTMIDCNDQWIAHGSDVRAALPFDQMHHTILREGNPDEVITDTMPVYTGDKLHTIPPCYGA